MSEPVIIGGNALWRHGWTAQIHHLIEVACLEADIPSGDHGVKWHPRSAAHLAILAKNATRMDGCLVADPSFAYVDALMHHGDGSGLWVPDEHDLDEDCLDCGRGTIREAMEALGFTATISSMFWTGCTL